MESIKNRLVVASELGWTEEQRYASVKGISLEDVYARLLVPISFEDDDDVFDHMLMLLQIRAALDRDSGLACNIYLMSNGKTRTRAVKADGSIENLFQGANPGTNYPGDRAIHAPSSFSIQVHHLDLHDKKQAPIVRDIRVVAVWIPEEYRRDGVFQPQR